jgi:glycosyltransferase involved in cell wall biosynthesis
MASSAPAVSVIIPVYGGEKFIERTLDSLAAQTFGDFEALCVDDHSPDRSAEIIKVRASADSRIRYLRTPSNQGIVPKVINGVRYEVRGRYFVYSSQDDYFSPDWLERMVTAMERSDADAVVPNLEFVSADGKTVRKLSGWDRFGTKAITGREAFVLSLDWSIPGNALWKSEFLRDQGYSDFGLYADEYTARCFFLKCQRVAFCDGTFYYAQGNPDAVTKRVSAGRLDYPYNQFRVWELVSQHAPERSAAFAKSVVRDLFEALVLISGHPQLAGERSRLTPAIQGMQSPEFRIDLARAFSSNELLKKAAAFALLDSPLVQLLAPSAAQLWRRLRRKTYPISKFK